MKFAVCFCIHSGDLEIKALLLAASLRKHWPATIELFACVPQDPQFGGLSTNTAQILDSLGVRVTSVCNPIGPDYPIANKLLCLDVKTGADRVIFLDSDIMALVPVSECELAATFGDGFVAKPADLNTSTLQSNEWEAVYGTCGAIVPLLTVTTTVSHEVMPPYFNSGVIATASNSDFGALWSHYFAVVLQKHNHLGRLHVFDQIPLSVAIAKSGARITIIDSSWNFPAHLIPLGKTPPILCHYHWPEIILREARLITAMKEITSTAPGVTDAIESSPAWSGAAKALKGI